MEDVSKIINRDIDDFDLHVNLFNLIGDDKAITLLKKIADAYFIAKQEKLPNILIHGCEGKKTLAMAFLNSLIIEDIRECSGRYFDNGIGSKQIFHNSTPTTAHLIYGIEEFRYEYSYATLWQYLKLERCAYYNPFKTIEEFIHCNGMVLATTSNIDKISTELLEGFDYLVKVEEYTEEQLKLIVIQRLKFLGIKWKNESILNQIIKAGEKDIKKIMQILKIAHLLFITEQEPILNAKIAQKAIRLTNNYVKLG